MSEATLYTTEEQRAKSSKIGGNAPKSSTNAFGPAWSFYRFWPVLVLLPLGLQLFLSLHHLKLGWDDAAITTAFSQTFEQTGRVALTPTSPRVEGYSSFSWFLLLTAPFLVTSNPDAGIIWMKVLSAVFFLFSLRLVYLISLQEFGSRLSAATSVLLLAFCYTPLQEIKSGMEMNFAAFLLLLLFHVLTRERQTGRMLAASTIGVLLLATRFEMPYSLFFLLFGLVWAAVQRRTGTPSARTVVRFGLFLALCFIVMELCRHRYFGIWMPNTVYAKRFVPYRNWAGKMNFLRTRWAATMEIVYVLGLPSLVTVGSVFYSIRRQNRSALRFKQINPAIWTLALGCLFFGLIFGQNWGYPGRMVAASLPFVVLALVGICGAVLASTDAQQRVFGLLIASQVFFWIFFSLRPPIEVTPISVVEPLGQGADTIRTALHRDHLSILVADVGGSALYHKQLAVLDSGLLTNPALAQTGWAGFAAYFRQTSPDLIETHSIWAQEAQMYANGLLDGYSIVAADGIRYFLRNDLYEQLRLDHPASVYPAASEPACLQISPADRQFSLQKKTCLVLDARGLNNNLP